MIGCCSALVVWALGRLGGALIAFLFCFVSCLCLDLKVEIYAEGPWGGMHSSLTKVAADSQKYPLPTNCSHEQSSPPDAVSSNHDSLFYSPISIKLKSDSPESSLVIATHPQHPSIRCQCCYPASSMVEYCQSVRRQASSSASVDSTA